MSLRKGGKSESVARIRDVKGHIEPRLFTPPLRELTPETSYGFDVIDFARDVLGTPLDPWQEWLVIHIGELLDADEEYNLPIRPRFRYVLVLVARQNGKTFLANVLALYWLFLEEQPVTVGISTSLKYAKKQWEAIASRGWNTRYLRKHIDPVSKGMRRTIGEEEFFTKLGTSYYPVAANKNAGRSLTINRIINDELRSQHSFDAWSACKHAMNAVKDAQMLCITNQGDDESIVLNTLRDDARSVMEGANEDPELDDIGIFEWSAPSNSKPDDINALAMANPDMNRRGLDGVSLLADGKRAVREGGLYLAEFKTEAMCVKVELLDPAIDPDSWKNSSTEPFNLAEHRDKLATCLDVSSDGRKACLIGAVVLNKVVYLETIEVWKNTQDMMDELPELVKRIRPRRLGWFPTGPAGVILADMKEDRSKQWPPKGITIEEIKSEVPAVCMSFSITVENNMARHFDDRYLNAQVSRAQKLHRGDRWVFTRRGKSPVHAVYAMAGATYLAKTLPPAPPPLQIVHGH